MLEGVKLIPRLRNLRDGPQCPLGDRRTAGHVGQGQDVLLDLGREAQQTHDLGHPGAGDALPAGNGGLVGLLPGLEERLPLDGLAEEFHHPGRPGGLGRFAVADPGRKGVDDSVGGHAPRQGAHVAVFERPLGPEGDLDRLFTVGGHGPAVAGVHGDMDDAEPDLGLGPAWAAASNTVTFGEPFATIVQKKANRAEQFDRGRLDELRLLVAGSAPIWEAIMATAAPSLFVTPEKLQMISDQLLELSVFDAVFFHLVMDKRLFMWTKAGQWVEVDSGDR